MAEVIQEEKYPQTISALYVWWQIGLVGVGMGVLFWILTYLVGHFVIDPLFCRSVTNAAVCANSLELSGNIAMILGGAIGLGILVRIGVFRPIIVVLAAAITLWGLAGWVNGLSMAESVLWSALLYGLTYVLYSWISRYARSAPVLLAVTSVIIVARIVPTL